MSIAINPMPAASSLDDAAAPSAVIPDGNSFLPFASILDEQSSANQEADDVGDADVPLDVFDAAVPASPPRVDSLAALVTASIPGTRSLLRTDEIDQSTTTHGSIKKDKPAVDPTVLLLQVAKNPVTALDMSPALSTPRVKADDVREADVPLDVFGAAIPASQPSVESPAALLTASIPVSPPLLRKEEIEQSTAPAQGSINNDTPAVDPAALLLLAAQNAGTEPGTSPGIARSGVTGAGHVGEADVPVDVFLAAIPASQPSADPLAALLTASIPGTPPLLRKDEIDQSTPTQGSIKRDKPAVDPTALLPPAAQNTVRQLDTSPAPSPSDVKNAATTDQQTRRANNDESVPHLFTALTETDARAVLNADSDDAPLPRATPPLTDLLIKASEQTSEAEQLRVPDLPMPRTPTMNAPAGGSVVDAIRLAINQAPQFDQDRGSAQSSIAGFDRRAKTAAIPAVHLTGAGSFDVAVRQSDPSTVPIVELPDEDGVMSSIVQSIRLQMRDGVGTAVVHLEPEYLGSVSISLRVENGVVSASLHAENPQVRAWMEANAPLLRESLAGQGLSLDRLLVTDEHIVDDQSQGRRQRQEQEQQAQPRRRRNGAATFEVVV